MVILLVPMALAFSALAQTITIESWRNDDLAIWNELIIPAFNEHHPEIEVIFAPAAPTEYNAVLDGVSVVGPTGLEPVTNRL